MSYPRRHFKRTQPAPARTRASDWPANKADCVTLMLASLAISMVITLLMGPQLYSAIYF